MWSLQDFVTRQAMGTFYWIGLSDERTGKWEWVNQTPYVMNRRWVLHDAVTHCPTAASTSCNSPSVPGGGGRTSPTTGPATASGLETRTVPTCTTTDASTTCTAPPGCASSASGANRAAEAQEPPSMSERVNKHQGNGSVRIYWLVETLKSL